MLAVLTTILRNETLPSVSFKEVVLTKFPVQLQLHCIEDCIEWVGLQTDKMNKTPLLGKLRKVLLDGIIDETLILHFVQ